MKIFLFPLLIVVECRMLYNANIDRKRVLMEEWKYEKEIISNISSGFGTWWICSWTGKSRQISSRQISPDIRK